MGHLRRLVTVAIRTTGDTLAQQGAAQLLSALEGTLKLLDPLTVVRSGDGKRASLTWSKVLSDKEIVYHIYKSGVLVGMTDGTGYLAVQLDPGTQYHFMVRAIATDGATSNYITELLEPAMTLPVPSAVGQVLRATGIVADAFDWGQLDLADTDAVTGILPAARGGLGIGTFPDFGSANLLTSGSVTGGSFVGGTISGTTGTFSSTVTINGANIVLSNGQAVQLKKSGGVAANALRMAADDTLQIGVAGLTAVELYSAAILRFAEGGAATLTIGTRSADQACNDLTIAGEEPYVSATGASRVPGNVVIKTGTPTNGGTSYGKIQFMTGGANGPWVSRDGNGHYLGFAGTACAKGDIRGQSGFMIAARRSAEDVILFEWKSNNEYHIGDGTAGLMSLYFDVASNAYFRYQYGGYFCTFNGANDALEMGKPIHGDNSSSPFGVHGFAPITVTGSFSVSASDYAKGGIQFNGTPVAGFTATFPNPSANYRGYWKFIHNNSGQTATIACGSGSDTMANGAKKWVYFGPNTVLISN